MRAMHEKYRAVKWNMRSHCQQGRRESVSALKLAYGWQGPERFRQPMWSVNPN